MKRDEFIGAATMAVVGVSIFLFGMWFGRTQLSKFYFQEPRVGDVYATYYDRRTDDYALTNGFPSENVGITKIVRIKDGTVYAATWSANISRLEGYGDANFNSWGPITNYQRYRNHYTLLKPQ